MSTNITSSQGQDILNSTSLIQWQIIAGLVCLAIGLALTITGVTLLLIFAYKKRCYSRKLHETQKRFCDLSHYTDTANSISHQSPKVIHSGLPLPTSDNNYLSHFKNINSNIATVHDQVTRNLNNNFVVESKSKIGSEILKFEPKKVKVSNLKSKNRFKRNPEIINDEFIFSNYGSGYIYNNSIQQSNSTHNYGPGHTYNNSIEQFDSTPNYIELHRSSPLSAINQLYDEKSRTQLIREFTLFDTISTNPGESLERNNSPYSSSRKTEINEKKIQTQSNSDRNIKKQTDGIVFKNTKSSFSIIQGSSELDGVRESLTFLDKSSSSSIRVNDSGIGGSAGEQSLMGTGSDFFYHTNRNNDILRNQTRENSFFLSSPPTKLPRDLDLVFVDKVSPYPIINNNNNMYNLNKKHASKKLRDVIITNNFNKNNKFKEISNAEDLSRTIIIEDTINQLTDTSHEAKLDLKKEKFKKSFSNDITQKFTNISGNYESKLDISTNKNRVDSGLINNGFINNDDIELTQHFSKSNLNPIFARGFSTKENIYFIDNSITNKTNNIKR